MITIEIDEGEAYDKLSILEIKCMKTNWQNPKAFANYSLLKSQIATADSKKFLEVHASEEYQKLLDINFEIFNHIDDMKKRTATGEDAIFIDSKNYERFLQKKELQDKYYPSSLGPSEQKFGY